MLTIILQYIEIMSLCTFYCYIYLYIYDLYILHYFLFVQVCLTFLFIFKGNPDNQLNPKKKVWETLAPDLKVNKDKVATFRGEPLQIDGKGMLMAPSLTDVKIK